MNDVFLEDVTQHPLSNNRYKLLNVLLIVVIVILFLLVIADVLLYNANYNYYYFRDFDSYDMMSVMSVFQTALLALFYMGFLAAGIVFILWFSRCYSNLNKITNGQMKYPPALAAWCWFIPLANYFLPFLIMKDMIAKTETLASEVLQKRLKGNISQMLLNSWWISYVVAILAPSISLLLFYLDIVSRQSQYTQLSSHKTIMNILWVQMVGGAGHFFMLIAGCMLLLILKQIKPLELAILEKRHQLQS